MDINARTSEPLNLRTDVAKPRQATLISLFLTALSTVEAKWAQCLY